MRVTNQMYHRELRPAYRLLKFFSFLAMNRNGVRLLNALNGRLKGKSVAGLHGEEKYIPSRNGGPDIRIRIFRPGGHTGELPGMLYIHGGGLVMGNPEEYAAIIKNFIESRPCVVVTPDYRKAFDAPYPAAFNDCYDTLLWMEQNREQLGYIADKLIVAGHSAGGGLTAAVTQKATDTGDAQIAFQIPVYPMLDDRQTSESARDNNAAGWDSRANRMGWSAYLRDLLEQGKEIPVYAAAARAENYSRLPPTITFAGDLEPFRDETIAYVENLQKAGVPVTFRLFEGCFHAFEVILPNLEISKEAWRFLLSAYSDYMDKYVYASSGSKFHSKKE